jgi:hypothetical protein
MKTRIDLRSPIISWTGALLAPFPMQIAMQVPGQVVDRFFDSPPFMPKLVLYYAIIIGPSYALFAFYARSIGYSSDPYMGILKSPRCLDTYSLGFWHLHFLPTFWPLYLTQRI